MVDEKAHLLKECQEKVARLEAENEALRDSAETFGALAERLNQPAFAERRARAERRGVERGTRDRRAIAHRR
jgi:cell division protein FtsB